MVQQLEGAQAGVGAGGSRGLITAQQLNERRCELLGGPPGPLPFQGVPVAVADAQLPVQGHGCRQGLVGPPRPLLLGFPWGMLTHNGG